VLPASATLGAPPDPAAQQAATSEHQNANMVASNPDSSAPPAIGAVPAMDPSQGPIGKAAAVVGDPWPFSVQDDIWSDESEPVNSPAARFRSIMGV
jgi:hypothetical protein